MKKSLVLLCFSFLVISMLQAQKIDSSINESSPEMHYNFMQRSKTDKKIAWILFASGMAMAATGAYIYVLHTAESDTRNPTNADELLFYSGLTATLASIPFFISAGKNKRKANLALKGQSFSIGDKILAKSNHTAVVLTIQL